MSHSTADVRTALRTVYGSWAGTLLAAERSFEDIETLLKTSLVPMRGEMKVHAERSLEVIIDNLPTIKHSIDQATKS